MIIFQDTRQQANKHNMLHDTLRAMGHELYRTKLFFGDYARPEHMSFAVDTKKDYVELAGNICGQQHDRFRAECERAQKVGGHLVILVEQDCEPQDWTPPRNRKGNLICKVDPAVLAKAMATMTEKYGVEFRHCAKTQTAAVLVEILEQGGAQ